jgi:predicted Zn-dependent protease
VRKTLDVIAKRPAVVSTQLANSIGMGRTAFNADVRKLKALGLTISFDVGYELSPRGQVYLLAQAAGQASAPPPRAQRSPGRTTTIRNRRASVEYVSADQLLDGVPQRTVLMPAGNKGYDIFPRTLKARLLLAIAFLAGLGMIAGWLLFLIVPTIYYEVYEDPPCSGSDQQGCLAAQLELVPIAQPSCEGTGRRVCFLPLGQVDPDLVRNLVAYYRDVYGLEIGVLTPSAIPAIMIDPDREQIDGESLAKWTAALFPADFNDPNVAFIGLTPLDLYADDRNWRFQLGYATWGRQSRAVVSTYRMHLGTFGLVDDERVLMRTRKLVTKYVGFMHYGLSASEDPTSPMYGNILSVPDLDTMEEPLSVATGQR